MGRRQRRRTHGSGSIRERDGVFSVRWYVDGERREETVGRDELAAKRLLQQRIGEAVAGSRIRKAGVDITVMDCLDLLLAEYRREPGRKYQDAKWKIDGVLKDAVGWMKAASFNWDSAWKFVEQRRKVVKDSTINRDLSMLRSAFKLAAGPEHGIIAAAPALPMLDEGDNVRTGFLTPGQYADLQAVLPAYLKPLASVAYHTGLRKETLLSLRLDQVDMEERVIWISRVQVKNRKQHTVPILAGEMQGYVEMALAANAKYLFERDGKRIVSFKNAWKRAVVLAGVPDLLMHDFRRTAVRDWIAAGADESTVMAISGHKTRSILERYNIIEVANVQRAARLREAISEESPVQLGEERGMGKTAKPS